MWGEAGKGHRNDRAQEFSQGIDFKPAENPIRIEIVTQNT